jgi:hypothetical protein
MNEVICNKFTFKNLETDRSKLCIKLHFLVHKEQTPSRVQRLKAGKGTNRCEFVEFCETGLCEQNGDCLKVTGCGTVTNGSLKLILRPSYTERPYRHSRLLVKCLLHTRTLFYKPFMHNAGSKSVNSVIYIY